MSSSYSTIFLLLYNTLRLMIIIIVIIIIMIKAPKHNFLFMLMGL